MAQPSSTDRANITVRATIEAPIAKVWDCWSNPQDITGWAFASDDWEASDAQNDLRAGGTFKTVMGAKDGSASFNFTGTYAAVEDHKLIEYQIDDGRRVRTEFEGVPSGIQVTQIFEPETVNSEEQQRSGWQAILDNFKKYVEAKA